MPCNPRHGARFDADGTWIGGEPATSLEERPTHNEAVTDLLTID
jgi:Rieske Fe-S protein